MKYELFEYLLAVEENQSFSKAAAELYISHSALSISVANFETQIGFKIFTRTTKGVIPTEKGRLVLTHCANIVKEFNAIQALAPMPERIPLKVASITTISNNILTKLFDAYLEKFPHVNLLTDEMEPQDVGNAVAYQKFDIGLSFIETERIAQLDKFISDHQLNVKYIHEDKLYLYVNKDSPLLQKSIIYQEDLKYCTFLSINHRHNKAKSSIYTNPIDSHYALSFRNQEVLKKYIVESSNKNCVAYLPGLLATNDYFVKSGDIIPIEIADFHQEIEYCMIYNPSSEKTELIHSFSELLRDTIHEALS